MKTCTLDSLRQALAGDERFSWDYPGHLFADLRNGWGVVIDESDNSEVSVTLVKADGSNGQFLFDVD